MISSYIPLPSQLKVKGELQIGGALNFHIEQFVVSSEEENACVGAKSVGKTYLWGCKAQSLK